MVHDSTQIYDTYIYLLNYVVHAIKLSVVLAIRFC